MRKVLVIGIGAGDPEHVTVQAIAAMNAVDVFFVLDKGGATSDLTAARHAILERFVTREHRTVTLADPPRDRAAADYSGAVREWRDERARVLHEAMAAEEGVGGILVWGDPALYDGTIRILDSFGDVDFEVIPGISSVQVLTARHRVPLNRVAGAVHITTGRRLAAGWPDGCDDVVVMLDADLSCRVYRDEAIDIYWGAYLGTPDELLVAGRLGEVLGEIERVRAEARARKGWIMDTYLLRRLS
ncbi:precorrin-6A synthase (deacetylating) [Dactylosporangium sp. AC04546]|uniref:precorrin-6A synthase (deacetylating) n=1 Tax=Dactylosporangium sp. AC04546 TaxID=2862460 RepID=UPI001EDEB769|nr:precorrin-6A synthase (deacetylating) [Dactylosporangium sp. AC04546]WVK82527.1 precorrin-6A synthase (deacetylating) [Dactylosporangium sp. AC04546]